MLKNGKIYKIVESTIIFSLFKVEFKIEIGK